jgi:D-beta-D-heptose 7-phosphate kinase/D-beta-D-heptose 1-phosphate adenosyltransferase
MKKSTPVKKTKKSAPRVLIIGEECVDIFNYCKVARLSPEAPVPVLVVTALTQNEGMAANVYANFIKLANPKELTINRLYQNCTIPIKTRYVDEKTNHHFFRVDLNDRALKITWTKERLKWASSNDYVIISDYNKGFLSYDDISKIRELNPTAKIFMDTKKSITHRMLDSVDYIKINHSEFVSNFGEDLHLSGDAAKKVIVTLGKDGAFFRGQHYHQHTKVETADVCGAGDTFLAALVAYYIKSDDGDIYEAIDFANSAAASVVKLRGVNTAFQVL